MLRPAAALAQHAVTALRRPRWPTRSRSSSLKHEERRLHRLDRRFGIVAGPFGGTERAFEHVDVDHREHGAVDPLVDGRVGPDLKPVPAAIAIHGLLPRAARRCR